MDLSLDLSEFPRKCFGHLPTKLESMPNLSKHVGAGVNLYIKRDDCTGIAGGGNKVRKLEFLVGDAIEHGADTLITQGAFQSNHARQTVACGAKVGMKCHVLLEDRTGGGPKEFYNNGNVMLNHLMGASVESYDGGTNMNAKMEVKAKELKKQGLNPYIIPGGGSNVIGALGYVNAAQEIVNDFKSENVKLDYVVLATGSSGTQAGLVAGLQILGDSTPVIGISTRATKDKQQQKVYKLTDKILDRLGYYDSGAKTFSLEKIEVDDRYVGVGYGIPDETTKEAISLFATQEGILLDPVYTGKGAAGLIGLLREGFFPAGSNVCFLHTGGAQALGGYRHEFIYPAVPRIGNDGGN